jgi:transcriptional regulator with XRE-family HTH domain
MDVGQRVRLARARAGLTTREIEDRHGLSHGTISNIENGRRPAPNWETIAKIAKATGHEFMWLLTGEGPERKGDPPKVWPNLERAIQMLSEELSERAVDAGLAMGAAAPVDIDTTEWILVLRNLQKKISQQ